MILPLKNTAICQMIPANSLPPEPGETGPSLLPSPSLASAPASGEASPSLLSLEEQDLQDTSPDSDHFEDAEEEAPGLPANVWAAHPKHIFVISEAGKPIYSLHGEEDHIVSLGGIMQALVSFVADSGDAIRSIRAGRTQIVFLVK